VNNLAQPFDLGVDSFSHFASQIQDTEFVRALASSSNLNFVELSERLRTAVSEARQTLRILEGLEIGNDFRFLEVGAGLGVTSAYLSLQGYNVTALEPAALGFQETRSLAVRLALATGAKHRVLGIRAEELANSQIGLFEVVFSNNVLEHVHDPVSVLRILASVLTPDGVMVHSCPNYSIPFEPHFGIPLVPGRPTLTRFLLPGSITRSDVWKSLNFIRAKDVVRAAESVGFEVHFQSGAIALSFQRFSTDEEFRHRHRLLGFVAKSVGPLGLFALLRRIPPRSSTPMDFLMTAPQNNDRAKQWVRR
jgi:2-polyprenyl-3-methyl-5-hydroxy-6-metoxy-1,4-benzoquinol methylase